MRQINETQYFNKSSQNVSSVTIESIKNWAQTVIRAQTPRNRLYFRSPSKKFEIWVARIPDKDADKGCSGGFRQVYFFVFNNDLLEDLYLDLLEDRRKIGYKKERPKDKEKFEKHLRKLKSELIESLES